MLDKLRAEALALIGAAWHCTLSTIGPAGVQASVVGCMVLDDCIYILVPSTVDHLFNIKHTMEVVLTTTLWQVRGVGLALGGEHGPQGTLPHEICTRARAEGYTLVEVFPIRIHLEAAGSRRYRETIDFDMHTRSTVPVPATLVA